MKKDWAVFKQLKQDTSGLGWNEDVNIPPMGHVAWLEYLDAHPKARKFRSQTLPFFEELNELFSASTATGDWATGSHI